MMNRRRFVLSAGATTVLPARLRAQGKPLVAVAGATGRTGSEIVNVLTEQGYPVRGLTRNPDGAAARFGDIAVWVRADVRDPVDVDAAVSGAAYLVIAIGASSQTGPNSPQFVDYLGVRTLVDAAKDHDLKHVVLISSAGSGPHLDQTQVPRFGYVRYWKTKSEDHLKASGVSFTIVGPGGLRGWPANTRGVRLRPRADYVPGLLSRADVALIAVDALTNPDARNKAFAVTADNSAEPGAWREHLADIGPE